MPWHIKNFRSPQLHNDTIVAQSFSATWSFASFSHSFHSNMVKSYHMETKEFQSKNKKFSYLKYQGTYPLGIEHFNAPTFGLQSVNNVLVPTGWLRCNVASFGSVATNLSMGDKALSTWPDCVKPTLKCSPDREHPRWPWIGNFGSSQGPQSSSKHEINENKSNRWVKLLTWQEEQKDQWSNHPEQALDRFGVKTL